MLRALVAVALSLSISGCGGRAEPTARFRVNSEPFPAEVTFCDPFPAAATTTFRYLVREDEFVLEDDTEVRRKVRLQYVAGDERTALRDVVVAFESAGFRRVGSGAVTAQLERADYGTARVRTHQFPDTDPASAVKGEIELDLPPSSRRIPVEQATGCHPPRHRMLYRSHLR